MSLELLKKQVKSTAAAVTRKAQAATSALVDLATDAIAAGGEIASDFIEFLEEDAGDLLATLGASDDPPGPGGGAGPGHTTNVNIDLSARTQASAFQLEGTQEGTFLLNTATGRVWRFDVAAGAFRLAARNQNHVQFQHVKQVFGKYEALANRIIAARVAQMPRTVRGAETRSLRAKYILPFRKELDLVQAG